MAGRPHLHCVGSGAGPDPPSSIFQALCTDYPELPRRVVGEVLARVYDSASDSTEDALRPDQTETATRALLDAICVRAAEAARRTHHGLAEPTGDHRLEHDGPTMGSAADLREALDPTHEQQVPGRVERLAEALEERARLREASADLNLLCEAAAEHLGLAAVAVSVPGGLRLRTPVHAADLMDLQQQARWPMYAPKTAEEGVPGQFVIPMQVGAARFGIFVLYLKRPGGLWPDELSDARVFAELALGWLIDDVAGHPAANEPRTRTPFLDDRAEIHQATGMVAVQLGVDLTTALVRLRAHAFAQDRMLSEVAVAVVARAIRFQPESGTDGTELVETT